ncbi:MAG TPA: S9 family peptidase [Verrucomicrobiae bacterium]|nr:S9 family peptidase [Verrucomicrobiae bacterium]
MNVNKVAADSTARVFCGKAICALTLIVCSAGAAAGQQKHPFQFDDWQNARSAALVAVAPDGKTILYRVSYGVLKGTGKTEWHIIDASGGNSRLLKFEKDFEPIGFTKDGAHLYGTFAAEKKPAQLVIEPLKGGKPKLLTNVPGGVSGAKISPDGVRFAALANPRTPDPLADVRTIVENERRSVYVTGADGSGGAWWCPSLVHADAIAWAPDGQRLAVLSGTPKIGHHEVHSFIDVCDASGPKRLAEIPTASSGIAWTNGGKEIVFLSTTTNVLTPDHVWTIAAAGGSPEDRTPSLKGSAVGLAGDTHGKIWVAVARGVQIEADTFAKDRLAAGYQWPGGIVSSVASPELASAPEMAVFRVGDPAHMQNLAVAENGSLRKITSEGDAELANVALGEVRAVNWTSKEGIHLQGIVTFPADYVAGKKYPFLVLPHGGPESNDPLLLDTFSRMIAGMGYVVIQPEYRGSTGYGSDFLNAIYQHFGDRAYADVDSATDYAIAQGWADPNRLAIFGWSAGGFMTSWTVTQTHRYRAAIEGAGITDWLSFIPTSDIAQVDYDARWPEEDPEPFLKFSAVMFADKVTTPLLILHGAADPRVPTFQGREYFMLLAERGKTVKMVTYPGSPHFPPRWEQKRDIFEQIKEWLEKYNP